MRGLNRRTLFNQLRLLGRATRADLAKSLGMSAPTAGKIVDELLALGVLAQVEGGAAVTRDGRRPPGPNGKLGRPGRLIELDRKKARFIGIELGVAETRLAALPVGADDEQRWAVRISTLNSAGRWQKQLTAAAKKLGASGLWGVVVSVPGIVDERAGRVLFSPNLHWTEGIDLRALVRQVWDVPVELVQEERALALGHQLDDRSGGNLLLVDFGDGVGGAAMLGGQVYRSSLPLSGELGHTPVIGNKRRCGCGAIGCIETLVSLPGLLQSHAESHPRESVTWEALQSRIDRKGLPDWLVKALNAMGVIIAGAINVLGLQRVVITGILNDLPPTVLEHLSAVVTRGAMWGRFGEVSCKGAPRRRVAGLVAVGMDRLVLDLTGHGVA